jgi:hypothetical protein
MAAKACRIKIIKDGYEFEAEGDKPFVDEMLRRFAPKAELDEIPGKRGKDKTKPGDEKPIREPSSLKGKTISIREFIQQFNFTKHTDITLAFGYYLEKYSGISEFTPADITNCYYDAKLESSNTSLMIIRNIKRGFMMDSKRKGEKGKNLYTLTASGDKFIKSNFSENS